VKEIAVAAFLVQFKRELVQFQGFISFALLAYWVCSLWTQLSERMRSSRAESVWFVFCVCFGLFMGGACALEWGTEYLLIALSLGLSVGLAMAHPTVAVCLFTSLLFLRPWELIAEDDYFLILPKLTFSLCIAHVFLIFAGKKKVSLLWNRSATYLIAFAVWCFVTTVKADDMIAAQTSFFDTMFKSVFLYLMITNALMSREDLKIIIGTIVITFTAVGLVSIYQTLGLAAAQNGEEVRLIGIGAFSNSNDIAALMVLSFPFSLMTALRGENTKLGRAFAVFGMAVGIYSIYLSQSRAAMLALALSLCLFAVLRIKHKALTAAFCGMALLALPLYMAHSSRNADDLDQSSSSRITYIKTGIVMGIKNPVLGVGYEGYGHQFERYATEIVYEWGYRTAHNSWILVFAETGVLGLVLFVALFSTAFRNAWQVFATAPEFLLAMVGYGITMSFLSHSYLLYPYLLYGLIGVARRVYPSAVPEPATPQLLAATALVQPKAAT
jgi:O-antigen ligase